MSWEEDERRVAEILGVQAGQRLPAVSKSRSYTMFGVPIVAT